MASSVSSGRMPGVEPPARRRARRRWRPRRGRRGRWPTSWSALCRVRSSQERHAHPQVRRAPAPRRRRRARAPAGTPRSRPGPAPCRRRGRSARPTPRAPASRAGRCAPAPRTGLRPAYARNGRTARASGQPNAASVASTRRRDENRHERRGDRVGEEVLDQLDVVGGDADQVARAPPREVRGGQARRACGRSRAACRVSRRKAMSWASHDSSQCRRPASGATTASATSEPAERLPVLDGEHDERAQHADADQRDARAPRRGRRWRRAAPRYGRDHARAGRG